MFALFNNIIYLLFYITICNLFQIKYLLSNLINPKKKLVDIKENSLIKKINNKTGLKIIIKIMCEEEKMIGFMVSSPPFKPMMIFSKKLYENFNSDELEWVMLHESAHYLMWHNLKFALVQIIYLIISLWLVFEFKISFIISIVLFVISSILYVHTVRIFEYQADYYAATHMDNPKGMITGNIKMRKANTMLDGNNWKHLFTIGVPYEERIKMAEKQLQLNKNKVI
ncbi:MAG: M48 family metalloprotease [bacterium]|nr:M48 family metalloprotease [bacterium]